MSLIAVRRRRCEGKDEINLEKSSFDLCFSFNSSGNFSGFLFSHSDDYA